MNNDVFTNLQFENIFSSIFLMLKIGLTKWKFEKVAFIKHIYLYVHIYYENVEEQRIQISMICPELKVWQKMANRSKKNTSTCNQIGKSSSNTQKWHHTCVHKWRFVHTSLDIVDAIFLVSTDRTCHCTRLRIQE